MEVLILVGDDAQFVVVTGVLLLLDLVTQLQVVFGRTQDLRFVFMFPRDYVLR